MNNKFSVGELRKMMKALGEKSGLALSQKNLQIIEEKIGEMGSDYLYKKIYNPIQKLKDKEFIGLRTDPIDRICQYLGFDDFRDFVLSLEYREDPQLVSLLGNYYSYVRRNKMDGEGLVFRSPVRIVQKKGSEIFLELKGPSHTFSGVIKNKHGCLFVLLEAAGGKTFHHVYKIGDRKKPEVLQGVFSGVSTAYDPIGGRAVLIRSESDFVSMQNASLKIGTLKKSWLIEEQKLAGYFEDYSNNNVAPNRSAGFGVDDL